MIVAGEKTRSYGFFDETFHPKASNRRKRTFKNEKLVSLCLVLGLFAVGVFIVFYFAQLYTLGHSINSLNQELAVLRVENQGLEEEILQMVSLGNIEYLAMNMLEMVRPEASDFLLLNMPYMEYAGAKVTPAASVP